MVMVRYCLTGKYLASSEGHLGGLTGLGLSADHRGDRLDHLILVSLLFATAL